LVFETPSINAQSIEGLQWITHCDCRSHDSQLFEQWAS